jgi:hypothetical protein
LAAQSYHRAAHHRFALAPSRLLGDLGIWLMRPLARRTHKELWRGPRAYNPGEAGEFLMGAPHGKLLKLGFEVSQATALHALATLLGVGYRGQGYDE